MIKKIFSGCLTVTLIVIVGLIGFGTFAYAGATSDWDWDWVDPLAEIEWQGDYSGSYELTALPQSALVIEPIAITVTNLEPNQQVGIRTTVEDADGVPWQAAVLVQADETGNIDLTKQAPISGSYEGISPMGLFWAMRPTMDVDSTYFTTKGSQYDVTITLEADGRILQSVSVQRLKTAAGVFREDILTEDVVGVFYYPEQEPPVPGVLIIGGSEGGNPETSAALWASHGYAALAVGYFGIEGRPDYLSNIPLETFDNALAWLEAQPSVDSEQIGIVGYSRGTEAAFLTAIENPDIDAVIAIMPSSVIWSGLDFSSMSENQGQVPSAWTRDGVPLPANNNSFSLELMRAMLGQPAIMVDTFQTGLENPKDGTVIPVEEIDAPILLISSSGDQLWPSTSFAKQISTRLISQNFPHEVEHIILPDAGHFIRPAWEPPVYIFGEPPTIAVFGGSRQVNGEASDDFWQAQSAFFLEHLR